MKKLMILALAFGMFGCANAADKNADKYGYYKGYETPEYKIVKTIDNLEIREYPSTLVAKVTVDGDRGEAANKGFKILAGYIFGDNKADSKIAMTSPVVQNQKQENRWEIIFGMPREYSVSTLPKTNDSRIKFEQIKPKKFAAIKFDGFWTDSEFAEKKAGLLNILKQNKIKVLGDTSFAYYDSPFTLPWNRRNEILVEIK